MIIDGLPAWAEFGWLDKDVTIGSVRGSVFARTKRCDATNVDPSSAGNET